MKYLNLILAIPIIISLGLSLTELSWWWILSPIWIPLAYIFVLGNLCFIGFIVAIATSLALDEYHKEVTCSSLKDSN